MSEPEAVEATETAPPKPRKPAPRLAPVEPEPEAFDLDAAITEAASEDDPQEAKPFTFAYGGKKWTLPPLANADVRALALTDLSDVQQSLAWLRLLLGKQWDDFPPITMNGALTLVNRYMAVSAGVPEGESEASSES